MSILIRCTAVVALWIGTSDRAHSQAPTPPSPPSAASDFARTAGAAALSYFSDYIVDKTDNICGLDSAKQLTNPAVVDYDKLMEATPEIRKMKKENIDEDSAKGIQLRTAAEERVRKACEEAMTENSHCSVWKKIKRRDGKKIPDITKSVTKKISSS